MDNNNIEIDYKSKYFKMVHRLKTVSGKLKCYRCPIARQCCGACYIMKKIADEKKDEFLSKGEEW